MALKSHESKDVPFNPQGEAFNPQGEQLLPNPKM